MLSKKLRWRGVRRWKRRCIEATVSIPQASGWHGPTQVLDEILINRLCLDQVAAP